MSRTVYVVKTQSGYLSRPEIYDDYCDSVTDAWKMNSEEAAHNWAWQIGGKVETLTLDSPSHGS